MGSQAWSFRTADHGAHGGGDPPRHRALPRDTRKTALQQTAVEAFSRFAEEIVAFDAAAATVYAEIVDRRDRKEALVSGGDAQIAATCRAYAASLATRNVMDSAETGVSLTDAWTNR